MRTIIYKCDRCGNENEDNKILQLEEVGVHVGRYNLSTSFGGTPKIMFNKEWCIECREKTGLKLPPKNKVIEVIPLTLEDLVREIAYEAAVEAIQNNN